MAGQIDEERMAALHAALDAVGPEDSADRARLLGRLAVEHMFTSNDEERHALADEAVAVARRIGDAGALADALSGAMPACYVPWRAAVARDYADELIAVCRDLGDPQRWAMANLWNFVAHFAVGEMNVADERLAVTQQLNAELRQPTLHWLTTAWTALRVLMAGDFERAEQLAAEAYEFGERTGQPDAFTWFAAQTAVAMRERGRMLELRDMIELEVERNPGLPAWLIFRGDLFCMAGDVDGARSALEAVVRDGRLEVPRDVMWIYSAAITQSIAEFVGDTARADTLYQALLPFRHLPVHGGVSYQGSAELYLAAGARATGRLDDAVAHAEAAVAFEERVGARTWLGIAHADLARTLRLRSAPGDVERAEEHTQAAHAIAADTGSVYVERRAAGHYA
jgi:hypothetical protein